MKERVQLSSPLLIFCTSPARHSSSETISPGYAAWNAGMDEASSSSAESTTIGSYSQDSRCVDAARFSRFVGLHPVRQRAHKTP